MLHDYYYLLFVYDYELTGQPNDPRPDPQALWGALAQSTSYCLFFDEPENIYAVV